MTKVGLASLAVQTVIAALLAVIALELQSSPSQPARPANVSAPGVETRLDEIRHDMQRAETLLQTSCYSLILQQPSPGPYSFYLSPPPTADDCRLPVWAP